MSVSAETFLNDEAKTTWASFLESIFSRGADRDCHLSAWSEKTSAWSSSLASLAATHRRRLPPSDATSQGA